MQSTLSQSKQVGLFPCRGPVVPCRTLSVVSATCHGTVKPLLSGTRKCLFDEYPSLLFHLTTVAAANTILV